LKLASDKENGLLIIMRDQTNVVQRDMFKGRMDSKPSGRAASYDSKGLLVTEIQDIISRIAIRE
jgi:hypothetical protein